MGACKSDKAVFKPVIMQSQEKQLALSPDYVSIRKNGIEFFSPDPFPQWVEMTLELKSPRDGRKVRCNGVVVACEGNQGIGYAVSMLFTGLSRHSQCALDGMAFATRV